jgi:predicted methyltransferase
MRAVAFVLMAFAGCAKEPLQAASGPLPITHAVWIANTSPRQVREVIVPDGVRAVLAAPDRLASDRALDERRQSGELLAFLGVRPGMRVAEIGAGGGYVTELLARAVGPSGRVYAVNPPDLLAQLRLADAWHARLARPANRNVVRVEHGFGEPLPARDLDLVYVAYPYGELASIAERANVDRGALLALKRGGRYVVFDRAPRLKKAEVQEARNARFEIERTGFALESEGRFFRSSAVDGDWNRLPAGATPLERQGRFVLAFVKP